MSRFRPSVSLACVVALPLALGGCAGVLVVGGLGAAAGGGYAAAQERGVNGTFDDIGLKNQVDQADVDTNVPWMDPDNREAEQMRPKAAAFVRSLISLGGISSAG